MCQGCNPHPPPTARGRGLSLPPPVGLGGVDSFSSVAEFPSLSPVGVGGFVSQWSLLLPVDQGAAH